MRMLADDDDEATPAVGPSGQAQSQQPAWMRNLHDRCREWLQQLPAVSKPITWHMSSMAYTLVIELPYSAEAERRALGSVVPPILPRGQHR